MRIFDKFFEKKNRGEKDPMQVVGDQIAAEQPEETDDSKGGEELEVNCASCHEHFVWNDAYICEDTPGSEFYNPPGYSNYRPRAFCPHCGSLVAEWHITKQKDFDEWIWFGDNEAVNPACPLPPSPLVYGWGVRIPSELLPFYAEHKLDVQKARSFKCREQNSGKAASEVQQDWKKPLEEAKKYYDEGNINKVTELLEKAIAADLPPREHAEALGAIADYYLLKEENVDSARMYYESSISTDFSGYWPAHFLLGLIYEIEGELSKAKKAFDDAKRAEPNKQLNTDLVQKARQIIRSWIQRKKGPAWDVNKDTDTAKDTVSVIIKVDERIRYSDKYKGEYKLTLPLDLTGPLLLNRIAEQIGIESGFHTGYQLYCDAGYLAATTSGGTFKNLREAKVCDGNVLRFIDWG
ncbi:MAG TPA: hypothetical protein VMX36_13850 [Sedimentisphaerales bacterium]|nr:hypothetical protein [Sedimentisphaerales bacterium]